MHSVALVRTLREGIEQVQTFLENTEEIIVWDTHTFSRKWDDVVHAEYLQILQEAFAPWWVRPLGQDWNMKLGDIWDQEGLVKGQGRIIFIYEVKSLKLTIVCSANMTNDGLYGHFHLRQP